MSYHTLPRLRPIYSPGVATLLGIVNVNVANLWIGKHLSDHGFYRYALSYLSTEHHSSISESAQ
jgi:hypothetical protein